MCYRLTHLKLWRTGSWEMCHSVFGRFRFRMNKKYRNLHQSSIKSHLAQKCTEVHRKIWQFRFWFHVPLALCLCILPSITLGSLSLSAVLMRIINLCSANIHAINNSVDDASCTFRLESDWCLRVFDCQINVKCKSNGSDGHLENDGTSCNVCLSVCRCSCWWKNAIRWLLKSFDRTKRERERDGGCGKSLSILVNHIQLLVPVKLQRQTALNCCRYAITG